MIQVQARSGRHPDTVLVAVIAGTVVLLILGLVLYLNWGSPVETPDRLEMSWTVTPVWDDKASDPPRPGSEARDLALYIDLSKPVGGFLPPASQKEKLSAFRSVVQLVQDHLLSSAGTVNSQFRWFGVAEDVTALTGAPRLERGLFTGQETRLDRALVKLTRSLTEGEVRAAALISDLNASDGVTGALGAVGAMAGLMSSPRVRSGDLHAGLLAIRSSYWGVHSWRCPATGDLGCWFSERAHAYRRLTHVAQVPFYVLIVGRGRQTVEEFGARMCKGAQSLGLKPQWELLSAASLPKTVTSKCLLRDPAAGPNNPQQLALTREASGRWQCVQGDAVELSCDLPPDTPLASPAIAASWRAPGTRPRIVEEAAGLPAHARVVVTLDCDRLRNEPPQGELTLRVEGAPAQTASGPWDSWTSATDETEENLSRTPQLAYFINGSRLRPGRLVVVSSPLLRMTP
ncbi:MAG TPA: hypothetical protein VHQ90_00560 [Thermoanaerobaculia bacterium]|nr:hypothetical protein [Thermoanaerobaculia bacterium]